MESRAFFIYKDKRKIRNILVLCFIYFLSGQHKQYKIESNYECSSYE